MRLTQLRARNFKSFRDISVDVRPLNVILGANASGKSNLLSLLTFLRNIAHEGLEDAISMESGSLSLLQNIRSEAGRGTHIGFTARLPDEWVAASAREPKLTYDIRFSGSPLTITSETAELDVTCRNGSHSTARLTRTENEIHHKVTPESSCLEPWRSSSASMLAPDESMLSTLALRLPDIVGPFHLNTLMVHDIDTRSQKGAMPIAGKAHLNREASNLAPVLSRILRNPERKARFLRLVSTLLPGIADLKLDAFTQQSLLLSVRERFSDDTFLPANLLSDGTLRIFGLVTSLFFGDRTVLGFEEPVTNMHPKLVGRVIQMMKDASGDRQIFLTTHNPEVVKHAGLSTLLFLRRDEQGFSQVIRPADTEMANALLSDSVSVEDLFLDDLLDF